MAIFGQKFMFYKSTTQTVNLDKALCSGTNINIELYNRQSPAVETLIN